MRQVLLATVVLVGLTPLAHAQEVLMTGGQKGDYFNYFAPPLVKVLDGAWVDVIVKTSNGTPENLDYVLDHQTSYALAQGNVYAEMMKDPKYQGHFKILPTSIGNEAVLGIMNDTLFRRSQGSWAAVAMHAAQVRFALAPANSGPGYTFRELQELDPDGLGKASKTTAYNSIDEAINAVANGQADATLIVQFANPNNDRFKSVQLLGLHFVPVISGKMKGLDIPGAGPAFTLCDGVQVTADVTLSTACSPILAVTGADNKNPDLDTAFKRVTTETFTPPEPGFAQFWRKMKRATAAGWDAAMSKADEAAAKLSNHM